MKIALVVIGVLVATVFWGSVASFTKERTLWRFLQLFGAACLVVVVLTHIAEAFHLFPKMGWGRLDSVGHYLDLSAAILGLILFPLGYCRARRYAAGG